MATHGADKACGQREEMVVEDECRERKKYRVAGGVVIIVEQA
jgi:hypothetical protein